MAKYEFNELNEASHFFKLKADELYRNRVAKALKTKNYFFVCFISFALTYLVYNKIIIDYIKLRKLVFRYLLCILYITYKNTNKIFDSKNMAKLTKDSLSVDSLLEDFANGDDLWTKIYNACSYKNDFLEEIKNKNIKVKKDVSDAVDQISNILYKQQSYFAGDQPLFNTIKEDKNNIVLFDELICRAINQDYNLYENKNAFSIEYMDEEKWRVYIINKEHVIADLKLLTFILKEAIQQSKTNPNDSIKVETASFYRTIANMKNGIYSNIRFIKYDKERSHIIFDFSIIESPLTFAFNDVLYMLSKKGIIKLSDSSNLFE